MILYLAGCYMSCFLTELKSKSKNFPWFVRGPLLSPSSPGSASPPNIFLCHCRGLVTQDEFGCSRLYILNGSNVFNKIRKENRK